MDGVFLVIVSLSSIVIVVFLLGKYQNTKIVADADVLDDTVRQLRQSLYRASEEIARLKKENDTLAWAKANDADRLKELNDKNDSLWKEVGNLRNEVSSKKTTISGLIAEKIEIKDSLSKELNKQRVELSDKAAIISGLNFDKNELKDSLKIAQEEAYKAEWAYSELYDKCDACEEEIERLNSKIDSFDEIINSKNPFDYVAHLRAHALEHVNEYVGKSVEELAELFKYQYRFEYLLSIYPELRKFKNDDAYIKYKEEEDERCNIKHWLSDGEYNSLSMVEREQLAVNRYMRQEGYQWSDWEKGRNYEIYCAYILYNEGYDIIQEGLNKKLEDKGRDIIAIHRNTGKVLIVQCKNWKGEVRENVVFQLFGSYAQWLVDNDRRLEDASVEPWLYVTGEVSKVAHDCAEKLRIGIRHLPMGDFPAIKCNVNKNTKELIYHLPFDRHYDLVKINAKGKGYKFSIAEAIKEGFRRAYNH